MGTAIYQHTELRRFLAAKFGGPKKQLQAIANEMYAQRVAIPGWIIETARQRLADAILKADSSRWLDNSRSRALILADAAVRELLEQEPILMP